MTRQPGIFSISWLQEVKHGRIFKDMLANMDLLSKMETQPP